MKADFLGSAFRLMTAALQVAAAALMFAVTCYFRAGRELHLEGKRSFLRRILRYGVQRELPRLMHKFGLPIHLISQTNLAGFFFSGGGPCFGLGAPSNPPRYNFIPPWLTLKRSSL